MLELRGLCKVTTAEDGQAAVDAFSAEAAGFELILMDMRMPRMDGVDAAKRIRALEAAKRLPPAYIIALTGNAGDADRQARSPPPAVAPDAWALRVRRRVRASAGMPGGGDGRLRDQADVGGYAERRAGAVDDQARRARVTSGRVKSEMLPGESLFVCTSHRSRQN